MGLRSEIYDQVTGDATIAALISDRCYPDQLPKDVILPAVRYTAFVSDNDLDYRDHDGSHGRSVARAQFDCYAETSDTADSLAVAIQELWTGLQSLPEIGYTFVANRVDSFEPALRRYRFIVDVMIDHQRG